MRNINITKAEILKLDAIARKRQEYTFDAWFEAQGFYSLSESIRYLFLPKIRYISSYIYREIKKPVNIMLCSFEASRFLDSNNLTENIFSLTDHENIQDAGNLINIRNEDIFKYDIKVYFIPFEMDELARDILLYNNERKDVVTKLNIYNYNY